MSKSRQVRDFLYLKHLRCVGHALRLDYQQRKGVAKMKAYSVSGITKSGRDMEFEIRAKDIEQADMIASVYFEFYAIMGAK